MGCAHRFTDASDRLSERLATVFAKEAPLLYFKNDIFSSYGLVFNLDDAMVINRMGWICTLGTDFEFGGLSNSVNSSSSSYKVNVGNY